MCGLGSDARECDCRLGKSEYVKGENDMDTLFERYEYGDYVIELHWDECPESPRTWDNLGTIYAIRHRYYSIGDVELESGDVEELLYRIAGELDEGDESPTVEWETWLEAIDETGESDKLERSDYEDKAWDIICKHVWTFDLYMYDHSGIALSIYPGRFSAIDSAGWDWGQIGWVIVPIKRALKWFNAKEWNADIIEKTERQVDAEIKVYNQYINGEVYGWILKDVDGNIVDSVWGYFDADCARQDAEEVAQCALDKKEV